MPSTPTLTLRASSSGGHIAAAATNPGTAPDHNELWRRTDDEYSGAALRICNNLRVNGLFYDHGAASGKQYGYFLRAVDGGGATADSGIVSASITLPSARLHGVAKGLRSTNLNGYSLALVDLIPHERDYKLMVESFLAAGAGKPDLQLGTIEEQATAFTIRIATASIKDTLTLRALYNLLTTVCLRDRRGNKYFGTMGPYAEQYNFTYVDVPFALDAMDYTEHF